MLQCISIITNKILDVLKEPTSEVKDIYILVDDLIETFELNQHILIKINKENTRLLTESIKECVIYKSSDKIDLLDSVVDMINIIEYYKK